MRAWLDLLQTVQLHGVRRPDRTGIGTLSMFGLSATFDNAHSFPAVTAKHLAFGQVKAELACFLAGHDNLSGFHAMGCTIWDGNGNAGYWKPRQPGDLGRIYGVQWRDWQAVGPDRNPGSGNYEPEVRYVDQLKGLVDGLRKDPYGRRHLVTAWNPGELDQMCLPPCHVMFQCYVEPLPSEGVADLSLVMHMRVDMRSVDLFLGLPFDVASYALLQRLICKECGLLSGYLVFQLGDAHIYLNHLVQVNEVLCRAPLPPPRLELSAEASPFSFLPDQAKLVGYTHRGAVPAPLNV